MKIKFNKPAIWINSELISGLSEDKDDKAYTNINVYKDSGLQDIKIKIPMDTVAMAYRTALKRGFSEIKGTY